jgi:hypothetical protein
MMASTISVRAFNALHTICLSSDTSIRYLSWPRDLRSPSRLENLLSSSPFFLPIPTRNSKIQDVVDSPESPPQGQGDANPDAVSIQGALYEHC